MELKDFICTEFDKLNKLAMDTFDANNDEGRKHRRAVMAHPQTCNHPHCRGLFNIMKQIGIGDIDFSALAEQATREKLK